MKPLEYKDFDIRAFTVEPTLPTDMRQAFVDFVANKPRSQTYDFLDCETCPLAQFGQSLFPDSEVWGVTHEFRVVVSDQIKTFDVLDHDLRDFRALASHPQTFGHLHDRLTNKSFTNRLGAFLTRLFK